MKKPLLFASACVLAFAFVPNADAVQRHQHDTGAGSPQYANPRGGGSSQTAAVYHGSLNGVNSSMKSAAGLSKSNALKTKSNSGSSSSGSSTSTKSSYDR